MAGLNYWLGCLSSELARRFVKFPPGRGVTELRMPPTPTPLSIVWMDEIRSHHRRNSMMIPLQIPTNNGFNHGLKWCRIASIRSMGTMPKSIMVVGSVLTLRCQVIGV